MISPAAPSRAELRRAARAARSQLTNAARQRASRIVVRKILALKQLHPGARVALYAAVGNELDLRAAIAPLLTRRCELYLPRVRSWRTAQMQFARLDARGVRRNRLGIDEPRGQHRCAPQWLRLIILPLVAFDSHGDRLGSGAGFYDRALAFRLRRRRWRGPKLIAVAFAAQRVEHIDTQPHDVPLDAVITETQTWEWPR